MDKYQDIYFSIFMSMSYLQMLYGTGIFNHKTRDVLHVSLEFAAS